MWGGQFAKTQMVLDTIQQKLLQDYLSCGFFCEIGGGFE